MTVLLISRAAIDAHIKDPTTAVRDPLPAPAREGVGKLRDAIAARYGMEVAGGGMLRWQIERLPIEVAIEAELADPTSEHADGPSSP